MRESAILLYPLSSKRDPKKTLTFKGHGQKVQMLKSHATEQAAWGNNELLTFTKERAKFKVDF